MAKEKDPRCAKGQHDFRPDHGRPQKKKRGSGTYYLKTGTCSRGCGTYAIQWRKEGESSWGPWQVG